LINEANEYPSEGDKLSFLEELEANRQTY